MTPAIRSVLEVRALEDARALDLPPWEPDKYRLWSVFDMMRYYNATMLAAWGDFNRALSGLWNHEPGATETFKAAVFGLEDEIKRSGLPVSFGTRDQFRLIRMHFEEFGDAQNTDMTVAVIARSLINIFIDDMAKYMFLAVSPARKELYRQPDPVFGTAVADRFPGAADDVSRAGKCLALDQWPACVFHCMRVLEHGIRPMAKRFNVTFDKVTWHVVLRDVEQKINELRAKANKSESDDLEITNYSEAAIQFRHFKDAWRNHAMHGRDEYDEAKAQTVFNAVHSFMQKMADILPSNAQE